jgi:hypothetical protein
MPKKPHVVSYIKKAREAGKSDTQIKSDLLDAGWQIDVINHALKNHPLEPLNQPTPTHFTKYSDWYTQRRVVYGFGAAIFVVVLLVVFA